MYVLQIDSSISGKQSVSRELTARVVNRIGALVPRAHVMRRDLTTDPLPHFPGYETLTDEETRACVMQIAAERVLADTILGEFLAADLVVIGAPMYNFGIPSQLKAWLDRLAVVDRTFRYTERGSEGLLKGKQVILISTRGGFYGPETALSSIDHQEPFLRTIFGFFGIIDIKLICAEGLSISENVRRKSIEMAKTQIDALPLHHISKPSASLIHY